MDAVAKRGGFNIRYSIFISGKEVQDALKNGQIDIIPSLGITDARKKDFVFTNSVLSIPISLFIRKGSDSIPSLIFPDGKKVAVVEANAAHRVLKNRKGFLLKVYPTINEALFSLVAGQVDGLVFPEPIVWKLAQGANLADRLQVVGKPLKEITTGFALHKSQSDVVLRLNPIVDALVESPEYEKIYKKWFGVPTPFWTVTKVVLGMSMLLVVIAGMLAGWRYTSVIKVNWTLRESLTERKRVEEELRERESLLRLLTDAVPMLIAYVDCDLRYRFVNAAYEVWFQKPRNKILGEKFADVVAVQEYEQIQQYASRALAGEMVEYERESSNMYGEPRVVHGIYIPDIDDNGRVKGFSVMAEDITERKRAEEAIRESEERFKGIFDHSPTRIFLKDLEGRYLLVNSRHSEFHQLSAEELIGKNSYDLYSPETAEKVMAHDQEVLQLGQSSIREQEITRLDAEKISVINTKFPVRNGEGAIVGVGTIASDVTEQRNLEAQLRESQKMEAVGQLAGGIAHDFNNLIQIINGYAQLERDKPGDREKSLRNLEKIIEAGEKAANLTQQLLTFGRKTQMRQIPVDLNELTTNHLSMVERIIGEDIELNFSPDRQLQPVLADPGMMEQVLLNLCVNARDAMPDGGRFDLATGNLVADREICARLGLGSPGNYVQLKVRDNGMGMEEEVCERIFEPFFTTKEVGKGTGLGLSMVHSIVQQHQGNINVRSELGVGTTFTITLPSTDAEPISNKEAEPGISLGGGETILIAEDEFGVRELLSEMLRSEGYRILTASNGLEAVEIFRAKSDSIDLVILDVVMPKLNGIKAHELILQIRPDVPVVFSTGYSDEAINADYLNQHGRNMIQKPYRPDTLLKMVRQNLDQAR